MQITPIESNSAARPVQVGRPVRLEAGAFHLASATVNDAAAIARWMDDPVLCKALGRQPRDIGVDAARAYVERFDRLLAHLLLVRRNSDDVAVGMMIVHIDGANRLAWMDAGIGERGRDDSQIALGMAAQATLAWIFDGIGLHKACAHVAEDNARTVEWMNRRFTLEATLREEVLLADGSRRTILRYGMLRSEWEASSQRIGDEAAATVAKRPRPQPSDVV